MLTSSTPTWELQMQGCIVLCPVTAWRVESDAFQVLDTSPSTNGHGSTIAHHRPTNTENISRWVQRSEAIVVKVQKVTVGCSRDTAVEFLQVSEAVGAWNC
jgi:hypothetical protein